MSGPLIALILAAVVIVIGVASYRRRDGQAAPRSPLLAIALGLLVAAGALALSFLYRRHG